jgi:hypothetical protein
MRVRLNRTVRIGLKVLVVAAPFVLAANMAVSSTLNRLSAEFQNPGEISTNATAAPSPVPLGAPGGMVVYDKTLNIPSGVAYITFSAQGDTHQLFSGLNPIPATGSALLMTASLTDAAGNVTVCQPMAGAKGATLVQAPWMTLLKLPDGETSPNNCDDGGGGVADCHDNAFMFSCCALVTCPHVAGGGGGDAKRGKVKNFDGSGGGGDNGGNGGCPQDVKISMASSNGAIVFYEDSTIYIDQSSNGGGGFCSSVGTEPHTAPTPTPKPDGDGD